MTIDRRNLWQVFFRAVLCLFIIAPVASAQADDNAVILMYHNVSAETPASTSVTPARFEQHMQYLADNSYTIWPLSKTLLHLSTGKAVPAKTVVLTFDDAYQSVYDEAFPVLKEKGWPFTVFVTTQYIDESYVNFMSWQQLREIKQAGGEVGNHSVSHPHFVRRRSAETDQQWRERIINEVKQAQRNLQHRTGPPILAVAYPYGEYSREVKAILRELGYFGLGQHSGTASRQTDFQSIPRFPMATGFDDMESFAIKVASKNLPVTVLSPADGVITESDDFPTLTMRLEAGGYKKSGLQCFASGQGRIPYTWSTDEDAVVRVSTNLPLSAGRTKFNCTAPSATEKDVFYWFSFLWMKPEVDGSWYKE